MSDLITLPRATVQQALEALEKCSAQLTRLGYSANHADQVVPTVRAALEQPTECRWLQDGDEDSGTYMASCNRRYFVLEDGTPTDNHMTHCCYCGKPLVEVPIEPEDNHD
jgi:hypothetical protein